MSYFLLHEPKRLARVETDSPKVNPQGEQAEWRTGHQPSRGIGGEPKRSADSPPRHYPHACGQTDSRQTARRAAVPSGDNAVNITEDVRRYAAEPSGARQIIRRMTRRASRAASQHALSEKEAIQRGMEEKSKEFVEAGAEVCTTAV